MSISDHNMTLIVHRPALAVASCTSSINISRPRFTLMWKRAE